MTHAGDAFDDGSLPDQRGRPRGPRPARVSVGGHGSASAAPDVVRVALGIRADATGVAAALAAGNAAVRAVSSAARAHGLRDRDIASTGASVQPRWDREGTAVAGYTAYHQLALRVRDLGSLNALVDAVAAAAGDSLVIDGITLDIAERGPLVERARELAYADALAKAQQYAALSGSRLGRVLAITEDEGGMLAPMPRREMFLAKASDAGGLPVEAGEHSVSITLRASWQLLSAE